MFFILEPDTDDSPAFTDDESIMDDDEKNGDHHIDETGSVQQKKTVAQIMRDKKKQTSLTLQW